MFGQSEAKVGFLYPPKLSQKIINVVDSVSEIKAVFDYIKGNGMAYEGKSFISTGVAGLTAQISAGTLINGDGSLELIISGRPSAKGFAKFNIELLGKPMSMQLEIASLLTTSNGPKVTNLWVQGQVDIPFVDSIEKIKLNLYYNSGNGLAFNGASFNSKEVTGLFANIIPGKLNKGYNGIIDLVISGTPSAIGIAKFDIEFGGQITTLGVTVIGPSVNYIWGGGENIPFGDSIEKLKLSFNYQTGNGIAFKGTSFNSKEVTGLVAKIMPGTLNKGYDGIIDLVISGRPSAIGIAKFDIEFGGKIKTLEFPVVPAPGPSVNYIWGGGENIPFGDSIEKLKLSFNYQTGNGIAFKGTSFNSKEVTGLVAKIMPGTLNKGYDGIIDLVISGRPSAIGIAKFDIEFGGKIKTLEFPVKVFSLDVGYLDDLGQISIYLGDSLKEREYKIDYSNPKDIGSTYSGRTFLSKGVEGFTAFLTPGTLMNQGSFKLLISGKATKMGQAIFDIKIGDKNSVLTINIKSDELGQLEGLVAPKKGKYNVDCEFYNSDIDCNPTLELKKGDLVNYKIVLKYTKSNGRKCPKVNFYSTGVSGLIAEIKDTTTNSLGGELILLITGKPVNGGDAIFNINLAGQKCIVKLKIFDPYSHYVNKFYYNSIKVNSNYMPAGWSPASLMAGSGYGFQTWMTENLCVKRFVNGDPIPFAQTNEEWIKANKEKKPAMCYYKNDTSYAITEYTNGNIDVKYGILYNWYALTDSRGLAPEGWIIPTVGGQSNDYNVNELKAGFPLNDLKSKWGWNNKVNGTNLSGFNALPSGARLADGTFVKSGETGYFWCVGVSALDYEKYIHSETMNDNLKYTPKVLQINIVGTSADILDANDGFGYSVRCISNGKIDLDKASNLTGAQLTGIKDLNQNKKEQEGGLAPEFTEEEFQGEEEKCYNKEGKQIPCNSYYPEKP